VSPQIQMLYAELCDEAGWRDGLPLENRVAAPAKHGESDGSPLADLDSMFSRGMTRGGLRSSIGVELDEREQVPVGRLHRAILDAELLRREAAAMRVEIDKLQAEVAAHKSLQDEVRAEFDRHTVEQQRLTAAIADREGQLRLA